MIIKQSWNHVPGNNLEEEKEYIIVEPEVPVNRFRAKIKSFINTVENKIGIELEVTKPGMRAIPAVGQVIKKFFPKGESYSNTTKIYNSDEEIYIKPPGAVQRNANRTKKRDEF